MPSIGSAIQLNKMLISLGLRKVSNKKVKLGLLAEVRGDGVRGVSKGPTPFIRYFYFIFWLVTYHSQDNHPSSKGGSPTILGIVTHHPDNGDPT